MRFSLFLISVLLTASINAQIAPFSDCSNAMYVCDNDSISLNPSGFGNVNELFASTGSNPSSNPQGMNAGCLLGGEINSNWIILTVATSGDLSFSLQSFATSYLDWIMWTYDSTACDQILGGLYSPVACNYNATSAGFSGMANQNNLPPGALAANFQSEISVLAGEQYLICFNAISGSPVPDYVHFNSFGTAQLACVPQLPACANSDLAVNSISVQGISCYNVCDGEINISAFDTADSIQYTLGSLTNYTGVFTNLCGSTYSIEVEDSLGCILYGAVTIQNPIVSIPSVLNDTLFACDYFCESISGSGIANYTWIGDSVLSNQQTFNYCDSVPNSLSLTGTDAQGCPTDTVEITFFNIDFGIDLVTIGAALDTVPFGGSMDICLSSNLAGFSILWDTGAIDSCITVNPVDSITQCVTITDSCGRTRELCYTVYAESNIGLPEGEDNSTFIKYHTDGFSVESSSYTERIEFILLDSFGREVLLNENYELGKIVNTEGLSDGMYYVHLRMGESGKIIRYFK